MIDSSEKSLSAQLDELALSPGDLCYIAIDDYPTWSRPKAFTSEGVALFLGVGRQLENDARMVAFYYDGSPRWFRRKTVMVMIVDVLARIEQCEDVGLCNSMS